MCTLGKSFWASSKSVAWFFGAVGTYGCVVFAGDVMVHEHTSIGGMLMDPHLAHISQGRVSHGAGLVFIFPKTCFGLCALGKSLGVRTKAVSEFRLVALLPATECVRARHSQATLVATPSGGVWAIDYT